ncbi:MAG: hypothetical protein KJ623_03850, partial [Nanoarchaeota archaeon]|nr:hypothetical protein [Nanoarchaeota archaeon]
KQGFYPKKDDPYFGRYRDGFLIDKLYPMIRSTVSIGVTHSDYALEPNELIQNADSAEHEAKKTKNKVICLHNY